MLAGFSFTLWQEPLVQKIHTDVDADKCLDYVFQFTCYGSAVQYLVGALFKQLLHICSHKFKIFGYLFSYKNISLVFI